MGVIVFGSRSAAIVCDNVIAPNERPLAAAAE